MKNTFKILFLLFVLSANAQDYKLGKVTVEELKQKFHPSDSTAVAAILFKDGDVSFATTLEGYWNMVTETEVKIKIYKKEAYDLANVEQAFYSGNNDESVRFSDAATYNLVDGKVEKTKMKSESEFTVQQNKYFKSRKISLPNVREGSVIEYKIVKTTRFINEIPEFYFQYEIPMDYARYKVTTPVNFVYSATMGGHLIPLKKEEPNITNSAGTVNRMTFTIDHVKAMKDEDYVNNINNYRSRIRYEMSAKILQNGVVENLSTDWDAVTKKIYDNENFGRQLERNNYFEDDENTLLVGVTDKDEKTKRIFNFIQSRMNWNNFTGYSCDDGVKAAYTSKTGNIAEINLMLVAMLRHAGIEASPVLVSTRSNGIALFPTITAYNYVIAAVESGDNIMLLDASSKNSQPNILPTRALNWIGRMIRKNGTSAEIDLMPKTNSKDIVNIIATIDNEGKVSGKIRDQYLDYNAYNFRENFIGITKDSYIEKLEKKYNGITIDDYQITNDKDLLKPVSESYSFSNNNVVEIIGDKMYFSPMMFFAQQENPFKQETREFPVDFSFPFQDKYAITITIPENYTIESLPAPAVYSMDENIGTFKFNIVSNGKQIQLSISSEINRAIVSPEFYETLKDFYKGVIVKQKEKVVLKKA